MEKLKVIFKSKKLTGGFILAGIISLSSFFITSCNLGVSENKENKEVDVLKEQRNQDSLEYIVDVKAMDYAFGMPDEIPSGWVTFKMKNMGKEEHVAVVIQYSDTVSFPYLKSLIHQAISSGELEDFQRMYALEKAIKGGPGLLSPNKTGETTVFLEPGIYAFSCGVESANGKHHYQRGMMRAFKVINKKTKADKPEATVDITLSSFAISTEQSIGSGEQVFNVKFEDYDGHDVHLARLKPNQDLKSLEKWMLEVKMPSPYEFLGGVEQVPQGMSSSFKANLHPGRYALVSHGLTEAGMSEEFRVSANEKAPPIKNQTVNPEVVIELGFFESLIREEIPIGRTLITIKNTGSQEYNYLFSLLKEDYSQAEFLKHVEEVYVKELRNPAFSDYPDLFLAYQKIKPGEEQSYNLEVKDRKYYLIGPLIPNKPWKEQWRTGEMIHELQGVEEI